MFADFTLPLINVIKYYVDHHVSGPDEKLVSNIQLFFCSKLLSVERDKICCFYF